jgi:hypothetical protein
MSCVLEIKRVPLGFAMVIHGGSTDKGAFVSPPPVQPRSESELDELKDFTSEVFELPVSTHASELRCQRKLRELQDRVTRVFPQAILIQLAGLPDGTTILLSADETLIGLPWEHAVLKDGRSIGERFDVARQLAGSFETRKQACDLTVASSSRQPIRMLIVADRSLPNALAEGQQLLGELRQLGPAQVVVEFATDLTKREIELELTRCDILHFAGHAEASENQPERIGLRLAGGEKFDAQAIAACRSARWPVLIFANACCAGKLSRSTEHALQSLALAFYQRGVRYLGHGTLIPDNDDVREFALQVYRAFFSLGRRLGEAVRFAREQIGNDKLGRGCPVQRLIAAGYLLYGDPALKFAALDEQLLLLSAAPQSDMLPSIQVIPEFSLAHSCIDTGLSDPILVNLSQPWAETVAVALQRANAISGNDHHLQRACEDWTDALVKKPQTPDQSFKSMSPVLMPVKELQTFHASTWKIAEETFMARRYAAADQLYRAVDLVATQTGDRATLGGCSLRRAQIMRKLDSPGSLRAYAFCESAEANFGVVGNECGITYGVYLRAEIELHRRDFPAAKKNFQSALESFGRKGLFEPIEQHYYKGWSHFRLAQVERESGNPSLDWNQLILDHLTIAQSEWYACGEHDLADQLINAEFNSEIST